MGPASITQQADFRNTVALRSICRTVDPLALLLSNVGVEPGQFGFEGVAAYRTKERTIGFWNL